MTGTVALCHPPRASHTEPAGPSIVMVREPLVPGHSLDTHVDRRIAKLGRELRGFELLPREDLVVGGRPAVLIRFRFTTDAGAAERTLEQTMVMVDPATDRERKVVVFVMRTRADEVDAIRPLFDGVLRSVRFEAPAIATPAAQASRRMPSIPGLRES